MAMAPFAIVSLLSSDSYLPGALAQVAALRELHPDPPVAPEVPFQTVCLVTPETVNVASIKRLRKVYDHVIGVEILEQDNPAGLKLLGRPDLTTVLTKLHVFRLTQFSKIIFLDADVLPIRPISHLLSLPFEFSAAPDVGWPDIFNSGVLVLTPGEEKFDQLNHLIASKPSWDGGDQGLLNEWRGGDWNRLSFTYNTTPTAAYTYAPAYERYGSQIKAIHFIGPNKPWNSLAYRTPFSGGQPDPPDSVQRAYDYDSLVDRWFDVYDRHYHSESILAQTPFEVQRYTAAWDQPPTENNLPVDALGLDELKRLAIQGINASITETRPGEGTYRTMPLEGRVDLMRPRKETKDEKPTQANPKPPQTQIHIPQSFDDFDDHFPVDPFNYEEPLSTPVARRATLSDDHPRWQTLPTPGPNEVPPSPRLRLVSLPPTPSALPPFPKTPADFYGSESEAESLLLAKPDNVHHHQQHHVPLAPEPQQEPLQHDHHPNDQEVNNAAPARPVSPPMVSWNPAVEPPPNVTPTPNAFPADTYFANVWDHTPSKQNDQAHPGPSPPDSGGFFQPPPASIIPDTLIKQGHYRNVTGDSPLGATPSPDRTKIKSVFPWEAKPRVMPGRVFPDSDAPPPSLFLSPGGQSQTSTATPSTPETKGPSYSARAIPLSPLYGLPTTLNYANAWDTIPSIQKYASRLVKPPPPPATLAPAFEDDTYRKGRRMSRDERTEMSSHDGDDEDNADDEDEHLVSSGNEWDDDSDGESTRRRSRRGSVVTATVPKGMKKEYKHRGVQTLIIEKRAQGVQADPPPKPEYKHSKRHSTSSKRHWAPATGASVVAPTTTKDVTHGGHDLSVNTLRQNSKSPSVSPKPLSPLRSPREFIALTGAGGTKTAAKAPPLKPTVRTSDSTLMASGTAVVPSPLMATASHTAPPPTSTQSPNASTAPLARRSSNDSSLGSPASSIGPVSPVEGYPVASPMRKATRVWDPARGVDLFKRGSEEVLARFLKMGAWEDENR
ncbi:glycosyltransferase family 8 protein [Hebeloma cylindrosporum]|uniref:glycogenin glucosyltransferase n=1 Tax=Hebeloma cylindrosporum TaxID=76867 RepID=A0A0C3CG80_HEBCY|nr:glycosyltransferase family 8 protein [Hebeloma cylindrosporum h7]